MEVAVFSGENYFKEKPRVKKEKEVVVTDEAGPSGTVVEAVPLINIAEYSLPLPRQQTEGQNDNEDEIRQALQNPSSKNVDVEVGSAISEADSTSVTGTPVPELEPIPDTRGTCLWIYAHLLFMLWSCHH